MAHYLLSAHSGTGEVREPMTEQETAASFAQLGAVEEEMRTAGAWVFSGRLDEPGTASVVRVSGGQVLTTDGPFLESKEHLGGFYVIEAPDLDTARGWASKVTAAIAVPIEVWPFRAVQRA